VLSFTARAKSAFGLAKDRRKPDSEGRDGEGTRGVRRKSLSLIQKIVHFPPSALCSMLDFSCCSRAEARIS
jgi:hypothetical protein